MALLWQKAKKGTDVKADKPVTKTHVKTEKKMEKLPKAEVAAEAKSKTKAVAKTTNDKRAEAAAGIVFPKGGAIVKPRITEKSGMLSQKGIYTFDVLTDVNSKQISKAIEEAYKVTPVKINLSAVKSKTMFVRGKKGKTVSGKKAYVFLKKGDTIEFI